MRGGQLVKQIANQVSKRLKNKFFLKLAQSCYLTEICKFFYAKNFFAHEISIQFCLAKVGSYWRHGFVGDHSTARLEFQQSKHSPNLNILLSLYNNSGKKKTLQKDVIPEELATFLSRINLLACLINRLLESEGRFSAREQG